MNYHLWYKWLFVACLTPSKNADTLLIITWGTYWDLYQRTHISFRKCCLEFLSMKYWSLHSGLYDFTHWGQVTHICVSKLSITDSDNGLSPGRCQAIIWTSAGIFLIQTLGTHFSKILTISFKKMRLKWSSGIWWPFCLGLNVLKPRETVIDGTAPYSVYIPDQKIANTHR